MLGGSCFYEETCISRRAAGTAEADAIKSRVSRAKTAAAGGICPDETLDKQS